MRNRRQPISITVETEKFNRHIKDFIKKTDKSTDRILKKFAFDLVKRIVKMNPVDTGRSQAGWYVGMEKLGDFSPPLNSPEQYEGYVKGDFVDHTSNFRDKYVEIINGVEYIIYLEYGHSSQAPIGMVRVSMRELRGGKLPKELSEQFIKDWNSF